jgi:hypothetical protein
MKRQEARLAILGFTVAAVGTVIGLILNKSSNNNDFYFNFALTISALALVITSLFLTVHHTQQIDIISSYIRKYIEPNVCGILWETRWTKYREILKSTPKSIGLPLGTSKPLAFYYGFLTLSIYTVSFVTKIYCYWFTIGLISLLVFVSLACSVDLYWRITKGWKINWEKIK